ncbi:MAG: DUF255 domain-containing protein [Cyanobacteria bacterium J06554_6]
MRAARNRYPGSVGGILVNRLVVNRLAQSQSLYLRKHADHPVDWWPWCEAALAKAKQENKPFGSAMEEMPRACPTLFQALDWFQHPTLIRTSVERILPLLRQSLPTAVVAIEENLPGGRDWPGLPGTELSRTGHQRNSAKATDYG